MTLPIIATLWVGGNLSYLEQLCLQSFLDHGHRTVLYTYGEVQNAPKGVEVLDAEAIYPSSQMIRHEESGSPALVSDVFRYRMLQVQNVIWSDADVLCMRPWSFPSQFVFGWEKKPRLICGAVLGLPRFSRTLARLIEFCRDEYPIPPWAAEEERTELIAAAKAGTPVHVSKLKWGVWGPAALTYFLKETGEVEHCLPQEAFYPISFKERRDLIEPGIATEAQLGPDCYGVHLWNRRLSRRLVTNENGIPAPDSFLGRALIRHGVDPRLAPLPDRPPPGHKSQAELGTIDTDARQERWDQFATAFEAACAEVRSDTSSPSAAAAILMSPPAPAASVPSTPAPSVSLPDTASGMPIMTLKQSPPYQQAIDNLELRTASLSAGLSPPPEPIRHDKIVVLTSMKNEGPFILEWIAYHQAIGVTHFLVYTNDCADNTNAILDRLAEQGLVTRLDNPWTPDTPQKPQHAALTDAQTRPEIQQADWVLTIDVDEFVNIHVGEGTFADLFQATNDPNVISFTWKFFGNDGVHRYEDRPVIEQFSRCAPEFIPKPRLGWGFKTMVHRSSPYSKIGIHRPLKIDDESNVDKVRWVNGSGRKMPDMLLTNSGWRSTKRSLGYRLATLNHYVLRSAESFLVKRDRGRVNHTEQDQGLDYWMRRNYTSETDNRIHTRLPMMRRALHDLLADKQLAKLHEEAVAWHRGKIDSLQTRPEYADLYHRITDLPHPDAIYLTKEDGIDDRDPDNLGIAIPEPEAETMTPAEQAARRAELLVLLNGATQGIPALGYGAKDTNSAAAVRAAPMSLALKAPGAPDPQGFKPGITAQPPASALDTDTDPRFAAARDHTRTTGGFFWEGPENALMFTPRSRRLVVSFDNVSLIKTDEQRWPWGFAALDRTIEASVLGVMGIKRNWFRAEFVHDAFDTLRDTGFFRQFDEVLFYGASMGGFGALTYARAAPGARVLAIAPQSTLDREILPDEDRWGWTRKLDWSGRYADAAEGIAEAADVVVISDPYFAPDRAQIARLSGTNLRHLHTPFFGHRVSNAFATMGILKPMLTNMFESRLDAAIFYRMMRVRRDLPRFQHDLLTAAEERGHPELALRVCDYTLAKRPARNIKITRDRLRSELGLVTDS